MSLDQIRILLVDDDADIRSLLRMTLSGRYTVVGEAMNGQGAIELAGKLLPDLILMDVEMPVMDGIQATEKITQLYPQITTIMVSGKSDFDAIRSAMIAGAREYVIKPFVPQAMFETIDRVYTQERDRQGLVQGKKRPPGSGIWSFGRATGGTGQTTLLISLAHELMSLGKSVIAVDLNLYFGHLAFYLRLPDVSPNIADLAESTDPLEPSVVEEMLQIHPSGLQVLRDPADIYRAKSVDIETLVPAILGMERLADYVLVDLPVGIPEPFLPIMDESIFLFLTANGRLGSLKSLRELVDILTRLDYPSAKIRPVLCGDEANSKSRREFDQILRHVDSSISQVFPEDLTSIEQASLMGQPVTKVFPKSPYTQAVRDFLVPILGLDPPKSAPPSSKGFFQRIFG